jgi:hypothetical protein
MRSPTKASAKADRPLVASVNPLQEASVNPLLVGSEALLLLGGLEHSSLLLLAALAVAADSVLRQHLLRR